MQIDSSEVLTDTAKPSVSPGANEVQRSDTVAAVSPVALANTTGVIIGDSNERAPDGGVLAASPAVLLAPAVGPLLAFGEFEPAPMQDIQPPPQPVLAAPPRMRPRSVQHYSDLAGALDAELAKTTTHLQKQT